MRERIVLVPKRLVKVRTGLVQELHHALLANLGAQGQRVDEHAHRVADAQIGTAVADGRDANLLVVGEARERIEHRRQGEVRGREVVLLAESLHRLEIQFAGCTTGKTLFDGIGQVGGHLRDAFHFPQTFLEEGLGFGMFRTLLGRLLVGDESGITDGFGFNLMTVHQLTQLVDKQVKGTSIENQVMDIGQKVNPFFRRDDFHTVQGSCLQVERLDELYFVFLQLLFA